MFFLLGGVASDCIFLWNPSFHTREPNSSNDAIGASGALFLFKSGGIREYGFISSYSDARGLCLWPGCAVCAKCAPIKREAETRPHANRETALYASGVSVWGSAGWPRPPKEEGEAA